MNKEKLVRLNVRIPEKKRLEYKKLCLDKGVTIGDDINNYIETQINKAIARAS